MNLDSLLKTEHSPEVLHGLLQFGCASNYSQAVSHPDQEKSAQVDIGYFHKANELYRLLKSKRSQGPSHSFLHDRYFKHSAA